MLEQIEAEQFLIPADYCVLRAVTDLNKEFLSETWPQSGSAICQSFSNPLSALPGHLISQLYKIIITHADLSGLNSDGMKIYVA